MTRSNEFLELRDPKKGACFIFHGQTPCLSVKTQFQRNSAIQSSNPGLVDGSMRGYPLPWQTSVYVLVKLGDSRRRNVVNYQPSRKCNQRLSSRVLGRVATRRPEAGRWQNKRRCAAARLNWRHNRAKSDKQLERFTWYARYARK